MKTDAMALLKDNSVFWSKLGFCYDPPRMGPDGKEILFSKDFDHFTRINEDFAKAGIKIFSSILFNGWTGVGKYDYELTDRTLAAIFEKTPDVLYIPRIKLNVPIDWCAENPEEVFVYHEGPRDAEGIKALVNTPKHDILGYDSPKGYYVFNYKDERPNVGGVISLQSFSSKKWLADAGEALRRIIEHIENGPYASRIPAYHLAYGACGETCLWGRCGKNAMGDYGIANRKAFLSWGMTRYGSIDALNAAWGSLEIPSPAHRQGAATSLKELLRGDAKDQVCIDYDLFTADVNVDAMEHFGRIAKERTKGKPVGYFYGYVLECDNAAYTGWTGYERALKSPYIDFLAAPKSYYRNGPGEAGGSIALAQSINRKKLWMDEIDTRTHLVDSPECSCKNFNDSRSVLWREFAKNMAHGSNFWWMDLGGGWFDSPEIMREIASMEVLAKKLRARPRKSMAQTLILVDESMGCHIKCGTQLHQLLMEDMLRELNMTGALIDVYRLADISEMDLSQYRLIIPLNTFDKTPTLPKDAFVLWYYAPGGASSLDNVQRTTGFTAKERKLEKTVKLNFEGMPSIEWTGNTPLPLLEIVPESTQRIIGRYSDGTVAMAADGRSLYCAAPFLKAEHLRAIMEKAGCQLHAPCGTTVYGDSRFLATFPKDHSMNFTILK